MNRLSQGRLVDSKPVLPIIDIWSCYKFFRQKFHDIPFDWIKNCKPSQFLHHIVTVDLHFWCLFKIVHEDFWNSLAPKFRRHWQTSDVTVPCRLVAFDFSHNVALEAVCNRLADDKHLGPTREIMQVEAQSILNSIYKGLEGRKPDNTTNSQNRLTFSVKGSRFLKEKNEFN